MGPVLHATIFLDSIGVGDGGGGGKGGTCPQNLGKIFLGQLLRKIWAFWGKNHVKFGNVVNFPGIYNRNSGVLLIFRAKIMQNSGILLIFHA